MSSTASPLASAIIDLRAELSRRGQRLLVWCDAFEEASLHALLAGLGGQRRLWVGEAGAQPSEGFEWLQPGQARRRLGEECDALVFDAREGFDLDAFGAVAGTLRAGGCLLLLSAPASFSGRFGSRLRRLLENDSGVARLERDRLRLPELPSAPDWRPGRDSLGCLSADQRRAVDGLVALKRRRPLVITADRGRGKSAALGIAAAVRLNQDGGELLVTAPSAAAVESLFEQLGHHAPEGRREGALFLHPRGSLRYLDPEALVEALEQPEPLGGAGSTMLVDEAAALPPALLARCLERFPRIAFATTTHGYEGSGRGFAIRFRQRLDQRTPDWRALELETPVRWAPGDPLEALTTRLLFLDAGIDEAEPAPGEVTIERFDRDRLQQDEAALGELFGLLVQAHYRTAPSDLARLLDQRGVELWGARAGGRLLGVAATLDEGGFPAPLAESVARGERRLPGELLPQSLALHEGLAEAALLRWRRVMRIAVHPGAQRRGIGRRLIERISFDAAGKGIAMLGASFGASPELLDFWFAVGCTPLRLGLKRERSSGEHALMVGRALDAGGAALSRQCREHFCDALAERLAFELRGLEVELAARLLAPPPLAAEPALGVALGRLGLGHAPLAPYRGLLKRHWGSLSERLSEEAREGLLGLLYQGRDEAWLARRHGGEGRAAGEALWRGWCARTVDG
ncbi:GNAT family N-acetyltransferase [Halotalea alkalilenta]|uniref:GNAT family N-acetyltransferase n=1 Tax=Halotalea alkalilenta TaxID=376489 RepID=UPI000694DC7D|nr:GNAT family N-acetyltransferase [Halotalea alkalilenta]